MSADVAEVDRSPQALDDALSSYELIGAAEDHDLHSIARLAAHICDVPTATVNLLSDTVQHCIATEGFDRMSVPVTESICNTTVTLDRPLHISDLSQDPRFVTNPWVTGEIGNVRFYAGTQLVSSAGLTVGTLCVFDEVARVLDDRQRDALDDLARQAMQILELRARAAALADSNVELSRSNADLSAFAGRVAHDLRNPIAATTGFLSLAQGAFGDQLSGRARECVAHASAAVERMAAQVDDLLAYAGIGGEARLVEVDLGVVAKETTQDLGVLIDQSGAVVDIGALPVVISDPTLLRLLLLNLVSNAVKYARPGVVPVAAITGASSDGGWQVTVTDNGRGIPAADRERVFELFTRLRDTADVTGSGIGLATCARVAEALVGTLTIDDAPGGGTAVTLLVPAA